MVKDRVQSLKFTINCAFVYLKFSPQYFTKIIPGMNSPYPNTLGSKRASQCIKKLPIFTDTRHALIDNSKQS